MEEMGSRKYVTLRHATWLDPCLVELGSEPNTAPFWRDFWNFNRAPKKGYLTKSIYIFAEQLNYHGYFSLANKKFGVRYTLVMWQSCNFTCLEQIQTMFRVERPKTIRCPAAHPHIGPVRECLPPRNLFHYLLVVLPLYTRFVDFCLILFYFSFAQETTHLELKQTSMLSAIASLTPFSDFNQSPRNMYQCQVKQQLVTEACFKRCAIIISNSFETKDNSFRRRLLIQLSSTQQ